MEHPIRLELTCRGFLLNLANHYTTRSQRKGSTLIQTQKPLRLTTISFDCTFKLVLGGKNVYSILTLSLSIYIYIYIYIYDRERDTVTLVHIHIVLIPLEKGILPPSSSK